MGVRDSHGETAGTPDPIEKGFATLNTIRYVRLLFGIVISVMFTSTFTGRIY
jgi:hypothetical protein